MLPPAPRNGFARRRIQRFLRHTYTRLPVIDVLDSDQAPLDEYGVDQYNQPVMTFGTPVPNQRCLYQDVGTLIRTDHGTLLISVPTLVVAWDDPLQPGDRVLDVKDSDGTLYDDDAVVESPSQVAPGGQQVYVSFKLRSANTPNEPRT